VAFRDEVHTPSALRTAGVAETQVASRVDAAIAKRCILDEGRGVFVERIAVIDVLMMLYGLEGTR
jgi:hypothetical protein